jgi:WD40 repeat protein
MNCEQVEELLSAYLDDALAPEERAGVVAHLQLCSQCNSMLTDFRRFDALLKQLPRLSPSPALRERIFSSPEYLELTGTFNASGEITREYTQPGLPVQHRTWRDTPGRPQLVAMPGGRSTSPRQQSQSPMQRRQQFAPPAARHGRIPWGLRTMQVAIAVTILLTLAIGSLIGRSIWLQQARPTTVKGAITPPTGPQQQGPPFPVGMRYMFLRERALWSAPADGSTKAARLTPTGVTVASDWVISPALPGRSAGDMIAYIDLQHAMVHTIRSDGQGDTVVQQPLLKSGVAPTSVWDTETGDAILSSLTWSKNGDMLAFVADPDGTDLTRLYIFSIETNSVRMVPLSIKGRATYPAWSPDGIRLAFELAHDNIVSILDYNTQNNGLLTITDNISHSGDLTNKILTLDWSPNVDMPAVTWSVGVIGHVHNLWVRRVGVGGTAKPQLLTTGDYVQAIYSSDGHNGAGSWLLVTAIAGRAGDLWYIDAVSGAVLRPLSSGKQVSLAWWSPDGTEADYLDGISSGVGSLHVVNLITSIDAPIAEGVAGEPAPAWSVNSQELVYSTGTQTIVFNLHSGKKAFPLKLHGPASAFAWSDTSPDRLVAALNDGQEGIYLVDTRHNTSRQVDSLGINGFILWTEVP